MKRLYTIISLIVVLVPVFAGCQPRQYFFKEPVNDIACVQIVSADSSLEFTVEKTLSDREKTDFLEQFQMIKFSKYIGDPVSVSGDAVRIVYRSGNYEMICPHSVEYVVDGRIKYELRNCDKQEFYALRKKYL